MTPAVLRALAVLLIVLGTSFSAHAHDETSHEKGSIGVDGGVRLDGAPHHRLSPSCPGVPGGLCCCGSLVAATGSAKLGAVAENAWRLVPEAKAGAPAQIRPFPPLETALLSRARPRAPPVSS